MSAIPRVTYWPGRGRVEPLRCIFAAAGVKFENEFVKGRTHMLELVDSGKLAYDQVPLVEIDDLCLVQSGPTATYLAQKFGFWPGDPKDQYFAGAIFAAASDARAPMISFPFHGDRDKTSALLEAPNGLWGRFAPKWESMLGKQQVHFLTGEKAMLGDIAVFEALDFFRHIYGDASFQEKMNAYPRLLALHDAVLGLGYLREWRDEGRGRVFLPWGEYAQVVQASLNR